MTRQGRFSIKLLFKNNSLKIDLLREYFLLNRNKKKLNFKTHIQDNSLH